jgi:hypothetical protein
MPYKSHKRFFGDVTVNVPTGTYGATFFERPGLA